MMILLYIVIGVVVLLTLLNFKTSRADGKIITATHQYRKMMPYIMRTRSDAMVFFDMDVPAENLMAYIKEANEKGDFHCDMTHCVVASIAIAVHQNPSMNRFSVGKRLYDRDGVWLTFSMKRGQLDRKAKVVLSKLRIEPDETFGVLADRMNGNIAEERTDKKTSFDKELDLLLIMPRPLLRMAVALVRLADYYGLLPAAFIKPDAMFTSVVVANIGSLNMGRAYHHLYEWGTASSFVTVGKVEDRAVVENGEVVARKILPIRISFDERIDDGLNARFGLEAMEGALRDPYKYFGCLNDDGSDHRPFILKDEDL